MTETPTEEGKIPFNVPSIDTPCFTYYKTIGDLSNGSPRVIVLHGGPGVGHEYLLPFTSLWHSYGLPLIFYDQIGCGASTHLPQTAGDESFWREGLFLSELDNLIDHLHLRDGAGFHILGQSWGGMFGANFAASRPRGLRRLVLASALADRKLGMEGLMRNRAQLPEEVQKAIDEAERTGDFESPEYKQAVMIYSKKHACRSEPFPPKELLPALKHLAEDKTVYRTM